MITFRWYANDGRRAIETLHIAKVSPKDVHARNKGERVLYINCVDKCAFNRTNTAGGARNSAVARYDGSLALVSQPLEPEGSPESDYQTDRSQAIQLVDHTGDTL